MKTPLALDDVFNEFVDRYDAPTPQALEALIKDYPQFRDELVDFAAAWEKQLALPIGPELNEDEEEALIDDAMNYMRAYCQERIPDRREQLSAPKLWALPKVLTTILSAGSQHLEKCTSRIPQSAMACASIVCLLLLVAISAYQTPQTPRNTYAKVNTAKGIHTDLWKIVIDINDEELGRIFKNFASIIDFINIADDRQARIHKGKTPESDKKIDSVALTSLFRGLQDEIADASRTAADKEAIRRLVAAIESLVTEDDRDAVRKSLNQNNVLDVIEESPTEEVEEAVQKTIYSASNPAAGAIELFLAVLLAGFEDAIV